MNISYFNVIYFGALSFWTHFHLGQEHQFIKEQMHHNIEQCVIFDKNVQSKKDSPVLFAVSIYALSSILLQAINFTLNLPQLLQVIFTYTLLPVSRCRWMQKMELYQRNCYNFNSSRHLEESEIDLKNFYAIILLETFKKPSFAFVLNQRKNFLSCTFSCSVIKFIISVVYGK